MLNTLTSGQRIRAARDSKGWTQATLADKVGVHRVTVAQWERGAKQPEKRSLVALSAILGVDLTQ
jgi:transcriptional regulator with XRE-family HTH domain